MFIVCLSFYFSLLLLLPQSTWAATVLEGLAAQMQPGTWLDITSQVSGFNTALLQTAPGSHINEYADKGVWNPITREAIYAGGSHCGGGSCPGTEKFIRYSDATNAWNTMASGPITTGHSYQHNAIDLATGNFYHRLYNSTTIQRYSGSTWSPIATIPTSNVQVAGALEGFPERQGLLFVDGDWGVWWYTIASNSWTLVAETTGNLSTSLPKLSMGSYHNVAIYNPIHKIILFGGGSGSQALYRITQSGVITTETTAPTAVAVNSTIFTVDPASGDYLLFSNTGNFWKYSPVTKLWTLITATQNPPFFTSASDGPALGTVAFPISTYGVVMFTTWNLSSSKVYLYKHGASAPQQSYTLTVSKTGSGTVSSSPAGISCGSTCSASYPSGTAVTLSATPTAVWSGACSGTGPCTVTMTAATSVTATFTPPPTPTGDFATRCAAPGVLKCVSFDSSSDIAGSWGNVSGILPGNTGSPAIDTAIKASGNGSLKFTIPGSAGNVAGSYFTNFSDNLSQRFGEGEEFYVQWRQRISPEFLTTNFTGAGLGGWKQVIIGEGDRAGVCIPGSPTSATCPTSCSQLEVVAQSQGNGRNLIGGYHSCGGKDGQYEGFEYWDNALGQITVQNAVSCMYGSGFPEPPCVKFKTNQWMTFQMHIRIGTWYTNNAVYHQDSTVQIWAAEEGQISKLVIDFSPGVHGYDLANNSPATAKYGKIWLLPYQTDKSASVAHPTTYMWYDELIISTQPIALPGGSGASGTPPSAPTNLQVN